MKKLAMIMAVAAGSLAFNTANAQMGLRVNLHLGGIAAHVVLAQPAPVADYAAYDNSDDYYYLPDAEAYYNIPQHCYYYNDGGRWVSAAYLPGRYHDYNWSAMRHYEVREARPFMHHDMYRERFGGAGQYQAWGGNENRRQYQDQNGYQRGRDQQQGRGDYGQNQNGYQRGDDQQQGRGNYGQNQNGYQRGGDQQQGRGNYGQNQNGYQRGGDQQQGRGNYGQNQNGYQRGGDQQQGRGQNNNGWQGGQQEQQNRGGNYSQQSNNNRQNQPVDAASINRFAQYKLMKH